MGALAASEGAVLGASDGAVEAGAAVAALGAADVPPPDEHADRTNSIEIPKSSTRFFRM
jgi:hypothetical protein